MKNYILIFFLITTSFFLRAQEIPFNYKGDDFLLHILERKNEKPAFCQFVIVGKNDIDSAFRYTKKQTLEKYPGNLIAKYGSRVLHSKPNLKYLTLSEIFTHYNLSKDYINLPVYVDSMKLSRPETILAVKNEIYDVSVINENNNKSIHIITQTGKKIFETRSKSSFKLTPVINNLE